jgi:hypothetical protein
MRQWWQAVVVLVVGAALGLVVAGVPRVNRGQTRLITATTATVAAVPSTAADTTTTTPTTRPVRPPQDVRVRPYNGTTVAGLTSDVFDKLAAAGYAMVPGAFGPKGGATRIRFQPGFDLEALAVASLLGMPPTAVAPVGDIPELDGVEEADVVVVVGDDLAPR